MTTRSRSSSWPPKKETIESSETDGREKHDFDNEARKLFKALNLDPSGAATTTSRSCGYRNLDAVWCNPKTKAKVFIGNRTASSSLALLQQHGISRIVNCTNKMPNVFESTGEIGYFRFDIYSYFSVLDLSTHKGVLEFFEQVFEYIDTELQRGNSVLIHCLAGAHRAGTTGVAFVMHAAQMYDHRRAITACKACRSAVDPIHDLSKLLMMLGVAMKAKKVST